MEDAGENPPIQQNENNYENTQIFDENENVEQENFVSQGQGELSPDISEATYESITTERFEEELSAVDLRITRPTCVVDATGDEGVDICDTNYSSRNNTADFIKTMYMNESVITLSEAKTETIIENVNYLPDNIDPYYSNCKNIVYGIGLTEQQNSFQNNFTLKERRINSQNYLNEEKHFVLLVDQETQTQIKESKEACVQTVNYDKKCSFPFMKRKHLSNFNHYCLACQRFFFSKSSFDRHKISHLGKLKGKLNQNFNECSRENFKIVDNYSENQSGLSTSLQEPKFQCEICCKLFSNELARDAHLKSFKLEEFPMTKCKECHVTCFTLGALNDHVKYAHKKTTYDCKSYCCIFCNESFECSFSFQLHLEDHLSE